jgi:hypothetical protein
MKKVVQDLGHACTSVDKALHPVLLGGSCRLDEHLKSTTVADATEALRRSTCGKALIGHMPVRQWLHRMATNRRSKIEIGEHG